MEIFSVTWRQLDYHDDDNENRYVLSKWEVIKVFRIYLWHFYQRTFTMNRTDKIRLF